MISSDVLPPLSTSPPSPRRALPAAGVLSEAWWALRLAFFFCIHSSLCLRLDDLRGYLCEFTDAFLFLLTSTVKALLVQFYISVTELFISRISIWFFFFKIISLPLWYFLFAETLFSYFY